MRFPDEKTLAKMRKKLEKANGTVMLSENPTCPVRATPAQNRLKFKSTNYLKVSTLVPSVFFAALGLSV